MDWMSSELVAAVYALLPGFLAAWIFYAFTAHAKPSPFERIIQALIFTVIVRGGVIVVREALCLMGSIYSLGAWNDEIGLLWSIGAATAVGVLFAYASNKDFPHVLFRKWNWSTRTAFPSEWYSAFSRRRRYVVLHLDGNRRLYGWPEEWPDQPDRGHFVVTEPEWLLSDGTRAPIYNTESVLLSANDVEMVEFVRGVDEAGVTDEEVQKVNKKLVALQSKENEVGIKGSTTSSDT